MIVRFEVPGDAKSFGTKTTAFMRDGALVRGTRKTEKAERWEERVAFGARAAMLLTETPDPHVRLLEGPVIVRFLCIFAMKKGRVLKKSRRPREWKTTKVDIDKVARLVLDALEGVVYLQDAQVVGLESWKIYGAQGELARTIVEVEEIAQEPSIFIAARTGSLAWKIPWYGVGPAAEPVEPASVEEILERGKGLSLPMRPRPRLPKRAPSG